jgi:hypothetical protein
MFLSLPIFFAGCALLAYLLRRLFGLDQPSSVYVAALPALVVALLLSAGYVRYQARRRAAKRR